MNKLKNPWSSKEGYNCFACAPHNPRGLHMEFFEDGDEIVSFWHPQDYYQGWVDTLHGGIISTLIDETAAWTVSRKCQAAGLTSRLTVNFKKPVMTTDSALTLRAHIVSQRRNIVTIAVTLQNSQNEICAEGEAVYFVLNKERSEEMGFVSCDIETEDK